METSHQITQLPSLRWEEVESLGPMSYGRPGLSHMDSLGLYKENTCEMVYIFFQEVYMNGKKLYLANPCLVQRLAITDIVLFNYLKPENRF